MKIYIDNTKTNWIDISTQDISSSEGAIISGYTTSYRIKNHTSTIHGSFTHRTDLTMQQKQELVIQDLKELTKEIS